MAMGYRATVFLLLLLPLLLLLHLTKYLLTPIYR